MYFNLLDQFKEYLEIVDNSTSKEIILDSCDFFTPVNTLPLILYIRLNNHKNIKQRENPRWNSYLWEALHIKKPYDNSFYPFSWINDVNDNSDKIKEHIFKIMPISDEVLDDLNLSFMELLKNIYSYSMFDMGFVMAQYFPEVDKSIYSFIDNGIGLKDFDDIGNLVNSDGGLSKVKKFVDNHFGNLLIVSNGIAVMLDGKDNVFYEFPRNYFNGTLVSFII